MNRIIKVLAVDDHLLLLEGIASVLAEESDIELVAQATSGAEAIERFRKHLPDVTLMDIQLPGMNGIDAMLAIRQEFPRSRFIVLTTYDGDIQALRALKSGASGYLLKSMLRNQMLDAIRQVVSGNRYIPPEIAIELGNHAADEALSEREIDILRRIASGNSNKLIGHQLSISESTVKGHVSSILAKLQASDRAHAVTIAIKRGYIDG